jgi:hypothetical protein
MECGELGECWETCHPFETPCPPELVPVVECNEDGCFEICVEPPEGEPGPEPPEGEPTPEPPQPR